MNTQNVISLIVKMSKGAKIDTGAEAKAKIESGFVDGDIIPMSSDRYIKIEGDKATGYKSTDDGDVAENSFDMDAMPEAKLEQLMAMYIIKM